MKAATAQEFGLSSEVLPEPHPSNDRLILWLPGRRDGTIQHWVRISTVAAARIAVAGGTCALAATAVSARQRLRSFLGRLLQPFRPAPQGQTWLLPNGQSAEQEGERQSDLLLVWAAPDAPPLDEARLRSRWPGCSQVQRLGTNLFLVRGVPPDQTPPPNPLPEAGRGSKSTNEGSLLPSPLRGGAGGGVAGCPRKQVEQLLAAARAQGDPRKETLALADLGVIAAREGQARAAVPLLEEALTLARRLGDKSLERDVLGNLGVAQLGIGQAPVALTLFRQELADARADADRFAEKIALDHLGLTFWCLRDYPQAFACYEEVLTIAHQVQDWQHEAEVLWYLAILHAERGQRDQAGARAEAAVALFRKLGKPQAGGLQEYLHKYRAETVAAPGAIGPGLLRMAYTALKSMVQFVGAGCQSVPAEIHRLRLQVCEECAHYTGVRCRVCGCFTKVKARLPHEECPLGKWPA